MKLKSITLENIRSHKYTHIEFEDGITIIGGRTGAGKSSILMAIEYALFGSNAFPNSQIMRRDSNRARIELEFESNGNIYKVVRGLKRTPRGISIDIDQMKIYENGKLLNLFGRKSDIDEMIRRILGYPSDVKPRDLFEILSYTRQDEIRKLIEMKREERQEYIDKILQLSKYKMTAENMKGVINYFENEIKSKKEILSIGENIVEEIEELKRKLEEVKEKIEKNQKELEAEKEKLSKKEEKIKRLEEKIYENNLKKEKLRRIEGEINALLNEKNSLNEKLKEMEPKYVEVEEPNLEDEHMKLAELEQIKNSTISEIEKLERELKKVEKLEGGRCPVCKQEVSKEHVDMVRTEFERQINQLKKEIEKKEREIIEQREVVEKEKQKKKKYEEMKRLKLMIEDYRERISKINEKINKMEKEKNLIKIEKTEDTEEELKKLREEEREIVGRINKLTGENQILYRQFNDFNSEIQKREETRKKVEEARKVIQRYTKLVELLVRLRNDIKNMREIVRKNYLEEFRKIFRKEFDEIRRESEYLVDIKGDYEPVAYSNGVEVPISHLSGGEKTSVALAYRLSLSQLASLASAVIPSKLMILDEPTTGLDREDVKALAETIRNITSIPQVIIVTHDETLKSYGDFVFNVEKESGESKVSSA